MRRAMNGQAARREAAPDRRIVRALALKGTVGLPDGARESATDTVLTVVCLSRTILLPPEIAALGDLRRLPQAAARRGYSGFSLVSGMSKAPSARRNAGTTS